jgi:hypothetical protein
VCEDERENESRPASADELVAGDDAATAKLMKLFCHRKPRDGMRPAAAQVEIWKMAPGRSLFYRAGFVLQREWRSADR